MQSLINFSISQLKQALNSIQIDHFLLKHNPSHFEKNRKKLHSLKNPHFAFWIFLDKTSKPSSLALFTSSFLFIVNSFPPSHINWKLVLHTVLSKLLPWQMLFGADSRADKPKFHLHSPNASSSFACFNS